MSSRHQVELPNRGGTCVGKHQQSGCGVGMAGGPPPRMRIRSRPEGIIALGPPPSAHPPRAGHRDLEVVRQLIAKKEGESGDPVLERRQRP